LALDVKTDELRIATVKSHIATAQRLVSQYLKRDQRLSDELMKERRKAFKQE